MQPASSGTHPGRHHRLSLERRPYEAQPAYLGRPHDWAASLVASDYASVYASTHPTLEFGTLGTAGYTIDFGSTSAVIAYLPRLGTPGALSGDVDNSTSTSSGVFGGEVTALKLNVDFSYAGYLASNSGLKFGDLTIGGLTSDTDLNCKTVRQVLSIINTALGDGSTTDSITYLDSITANPNGSYGGGTAATFAHDYLVNGPSL